MNTEDLVTVAEAMGDEPHVEPVATPVEPPRLKGQPAFPTPGIYFGMPEEEYHAIHAASASGIKRLSISSMDYWATSCLNEEREEAAAKDSGSLTPMQLGSAYHSYICEGPLAFAERYAVALDKDVMRLNAEAKGFPFCVTVADIRVAIDAAGGKPKGTGKDALIDQLLEFNADAVVWEREVAKHAEANDGKLMISPKLFRRIAIAEAMISSDPQLKDAFKGGHAEVSIFFYHPTTGVPCKARLDYLKTNHLVDLKSFGNQMGRPVQRAIDMAISQNKYYIPVVFYSMAIEAAKQMVRDSKGSCIHIGTGYDRYTGDKYKALEKWVWDWAHQPAPDVLFVFQQSGIAPVTRGRIMPRSTTYAVTETAVEMLLKKWKKCAVTYGCDPWIDIEGVVATADDELSMSATDFGDIMYG